MGGDTVVPSARLKRIARTEGERGWISEGKQLLGV